MMSTILTPIRMAELSAPVRRQAAFCGALPGDAAFEMRRGEKVIGELFFSRGLELAAIGIFEFGGKGDGHIYAVDTDRAGSPEEAVSRWDAGRWPDA